MGMIIFRNDGVIDMRAVLTFGVSSKETDNPIGQFGTGIKYAIAICLRHDLEVEICAGKERYVFDKRTERIRVDDFDVVTMNGEPTGFTTHLGATWHLWMAYRELYCNALDEGGEVLRRRDGRPTLRRDSTSVIVRGAAFERIYASRDQYFVGSRRPIIRGRFVDVYDKRRSGDGPLYLQGVRVGSTHHESIFDYGFHEGVALSEDRTIKHAFQPLNLIQREVQASEDRRFIRSMLLVPYDKYEGRIDYCDGYRDGDNYGETFLDVVGEMRHEMLDVGINLSAIRVHRKRREQDVMPTESCELSDVEQMQLARATAFCLEALRVNVAAYPIIVVDLVGRLLGVAGREQQTIYITRESFANGTKYVALALLEEFVHLRDEVDDESFAQKWVYLKMIAELGERIWGQPL